MITNKQATVLKQSLQQRLSPMQLQYVKLLQLPSTELSHRIEEEVEANPVLEYTDEEVSSGTLDTVAGSDEATDTSGSDEDGLKWMQTTNRDILHAGLAGRVSKGDTSYDSPHSYTESPLEMVERQIELLDLDEKQRLIADQIVGSLDIDGYFRRDMVSVADSIAFNHGIHVSEYEVYDVLMKIQTLEPAGIAARDLQECLMIQLQNAPATTRGRDEALKIIRTKWELFEKKHFDKIAHQLGFSDAMMADAYHCIQSLDPKPGKTTDPIETNLAVIPDLLVVPIGNEMNAGDADAVVGGLAVILAREKQHKVRISPYYASLYEKIKSSPTSHREQKQAEAFLRSNMDAAQSFLESLKLRGDTLLAVAKHLVKHQEVFFTTGKQMRPLVMREIAERIGMDISTVSRVVNGKYVQTNHGTYELRSFFNEGIDTDAGEEVTNKEVQHLLHDIIEKEDKEHPLSDQAITDELKRRGFSLARRTVTKYREALGLPVARLRREVL